jgi:hypothetical protein
LHRAANLRTGIAFPRSPIAAAWPATVASSFNFLSFSFRRVLQMTVSKAFFIEIVAIGAFAEPSWRSIDTLLRPSLALHPMATP